MPSRTASRNTIPVHRSISSMRRAWQNVRKPLLLAKAGKMNGCLIEGMACPGGCIAGAGTNIAIPVAARAVDKFKNEAEKKVPDESVDQEMVELEKE